jgi:hypothetical protein
VVAGSWNLLAQEVRDGEFNLSEFSLSGDSFGSGAATWNNLLHEITELLAEALPAKSSVGVYDSGFAPNGLPVTTIMEYWQGCSRPLRKHVSKQLYTTDRDLMSMQTTPRPDDASVRYPDFTTKWNFVQITTLINTGRGDGKRWL